jgi:G3E family GTPase
MSNGCIAAPFANCATRCVTMRSAGELDFERVVIETTGVADPGPVAQTFFADERIAELFVEDDSDSGGRKTRRHPIE